MQPLLVEPKMVEESERILSAEEAALRTAMEAKLRDSVQVIEHVSIAVAPSMRAGSPHEMVVSVAEEVRADCIASGSHSPRHVFDLGSTVQAGNYHGEEGSIDEPSTDRGNPLHPVDRP